mmetsp:Transcript_5713/g.21610  ORF Transcript_5713/g.21610 Transcript_5713/m.21610 type:complete len:315 (-) Transcript_5713:911-1855(-)
MASRKQKSIAITKQQKRHSTKKRKDTSGELKGDSTVDYQMGTQEQDTDLRSKKNVQKNAKKSHQKETVAPSSTKKKKKKSTPVKLTKQTATKAISEVSSEKSVDTKSKAATEEVSTEKAQRKMRDHASMKKDSLRKMALFAVADKQCVQRATMFRFIKNAAQTVVAKDGLQNVKWRFDAMAMIHQSAEDYLSNIFFVADMLCTMRGVETISTADFKMATAIANGELNIHMHRKRKRDLIESMKGGKNLEIFSPEEILEGVTYDELNNLKMPNRFKMEAYLPGGEEKIEERPKKKRKEQAEDTQEMEETYASDTV